MDEREKLFVAEYIKNMGNAYQAALAAGYKENTAKNAWEWLEETRSNSDKKRHLPYKPYLEKAIDEEFKKIKSEKIIDSTELLERITGIIRGEEKEETPIGTDADGNAITVKVVSQKNQIKCMELMSKLQGLFTVKVEAPQLSQRLSDIISQMGGGGDLGE